MGSRFALAVLLLGACKAELGGHAVDNEVMDAPFEEQDIDAQQKIYMDAAPDSPLGAWGTATKVPGADSTLQEDDCTLSSNALELYFKRVDADSANLYMMTRASTSGAWSTPVLVPNVNLTTAAEESPRLTTDDLTMYFGRGGEIYKTTRADLASQWQAPTIVTGLNTTTYEKWAAVCDTGYAIVSRGVTGRGQDLYAGTTTAATTALDNLNTTFAEQGTFLSADCLHLYFQSPRDGTSDIFESSRPTITDAWSAPNKLVDFNTTTYGEEDPWISTDQRTFVFVSNVSGNKDVYISTR